MANIQLVDVTVHVDETLTDEKRAQLEKDLRALDGVISVHTSKQTPHLAVVTYDPEHMKNREIIRAVLGERLHAQLIGL